MRFVIEQYREELITSLHGSIDEARVAEDREAVASDLLNILHRFVGVFPSVDSPTVPEAPRTYLVLTIESVAFLSNPLPRTDLHW